MSISPYVMTGSVPLYDRPRLVINAYVVGTPGLTSVELGWALELHDLHVAKTFFYLIKEHSDLRNTLFDLHKHGKTSAALEGSMAAEVTIFLNDCIEKYQILFEDIRQHRAGEDFVTWFADRSVAALEWVGEYWDKQTGASTSGKNDVGYQTYTNYANADDTIEYVREQS